MRNLRLLVMAALLLGSVLLAGCGNSTADDANKPADIPKKSK